MRRIGRQHCKYIVFIAAFGVPGSFRSRTHRATSCPEFSGLVWKKYISTVWNFKKMRWIFLILCVFVSTSTDFARDWLLLMSSIKMWDRFSPWIHSISTFPVVEPSCHLGICSDIPVLRVYLQWCQVGEKDKFGYGLLPPILSVSANQSIW